MSRGIFVRRRIVQWEEVERLLESRELYYLMPHANYIVPKMELPKIIQEQAEQRQYNYVLQEIKYLVVGSLRDLEEARDENNILKIYEILETYHKQKDGWLILFRNFNREYCDHLFTNFIPSDPIPMRLDGPIYTENQNNRVNQVFGRSDFDLPDDPHPYQMIDI